VRHCYRLYSLVFTSSGLESNRWVIWSKHVGPLNLVEATSDQYAKTDRHFSCVDHTEVCIPPAARCSHLVDVVDELVHVLEPGVGITVHEVGPHGQHDIICPELGGLPQVVVDEGRHALLHVNIEQAGVVLQTRDKASAGGHLYSLA
jgi:hypothetical protein